MVDLATSVPNARVLDAGCGIGVLAGELSRIGLNVTGIDISRGSLEVARHCKTLTFPFSSAAPKFLQKNEEPNLT